MLLNQYFEDKAIQYQRPLKHRTVRPKQKVQIVSSQDAFQNLKVLPCEEVKLPCVMKAGDHVIFDFGDHCVGYFHFAIDKAPTTQIVDSPVKLKFTFGEFPLEIETPPEEYKGKLGNGWLQNETKNIVFTPYSGCLERRYTFRYVKVERIDNAPFSIVIEDLFADCVSAVELADAPVCALNDPVLNRIYEMSVKTLKDCEQDVFEDGPKRDRRMWIGDLRLQALTDYVTYQNTDLVKRCLYLFAAYRTDEGLVSPYIFQNSPPYTDGWIYVDYSLFFISCLYDYIMYSGDQAVLKELYPTAKEQAILVADRLNKDSGTIEAKPFIDWCPDLDKSVAVLGVYIFTLRQLCWMAEQLQEETAWILAIIQEVTAILLRFYDPELGLFVTGNGQISWHSQLWAILSEVVSGENAKELLQTTQRENPRFIPHTPYMMHCYLEALDRCGMQENVIAVMKDFWGKIADAGFDCCPEIFNPEDPFESPYGAPEINSACHAWSCTPAYWIHKYFLGK